MLLQQAVRLRPQAVEGHNNLGLAYTALGRFAEAEACFREALRLDPGYVEAHNNLGSVYKEQGRLEEALACYQTALWLEPAVGLHALQPLAGAVAERGYSEGWQEYEWRWKRKQAVKRALRQPRWDGKDLAGKTILLWCEQGLGDAIQFVRYAAGQGEGRAGGAGVPGVHDPALLDLHGVDALAGEGATPPEFDVQAPLMSLPGLLGTTPETAPAGASYLHADPVRAEHWKGRLEALHGLKVGVVWQGNPNHSWDRWRSFPLASLAPLAAVEGVRLVSLQKGPAVEQLKALKGRFAMEEWARGWTGREGRSWTRRR